MKGLFSSLKLYKKESILAPLFKMLEAAFDLIVPLIMADIINTGIAGQDLPYILKRSGLLVILALVGFACSVTAQYFAARAAVGCAAALRRSLFAHIQSLGFSELDALGPSTLVTRMTSDINQVQSGVNLFLRLFLRSPFVVFGAMVMAFTVDRQIALLFAAAIPALAAVIFGIMLWTMPLYKKVQARLDRILGITRENLSGVRVVRAFNRETAEIQRFETANGALAGTQCKVGRISALMNPLTYLIVNLAVIAILHSGAAAVDAGRLLPGDLVALISYMTQILIELVKLANLIIQVTKAVACAGRVQSVLDIQPAMQFPEALSPRPQGNGEAVRFTHVSLRYRGAGAESLTDISFEALCGQTIGVIGGTGSGKSSLVNLIPRFYDASAGEIRVLGRPVQDWPREVLRKKIGTVMQRAQLFSGTVRSNLCWGCAGASDTQLWAALETAQAADFVHAAPGGLDAPVEQGGRNFSGGQRQRLTIARALVTEPEILILDDSASALDFATDAALRRALAALAGKTTIFIVSQRTSSLRHADQILVLDDGHLAGCGTHDGLLASCAVYREIYESQFQKGDAAHA